MNEASFRRHRQKWGQLVWDELEEDFTRSVSKKLPGKKRDMWSHGTKQGQGQVTDVAKKRSSLQRNVTKKWHKKQNSMHTCTGLWWVCVFK